MKTLHTTGKGRMMDTLEKFYIFRETKISNQINDRLTIKPNIIFKTIVQKDPHRGLPTSTQIATLDSVLQGLHLCPNGKELCDREKTSPEGHPTPTVTTARGH